LWIYGKTGTNPMPVIIVLHIDIVQPDKRDRWKGGTTADAKEEGNLPI
jgi:hypothetical protein